LKKTFFFSIWKWRIVYEALKHEITINYRPWILANFGGGDAIRAEHCTVGTLAPHSGHSYWQIDDQNAWVSGHWALCHRRQRQIVCRENLALFVKKIKLIIFEIFTWLHDKASTLFSKMAKKKKSRNIFSIIFIKFIRLSKNKLFFARVNIYICLFFRSFFAKNVYWWFK
jgi:hypothetical protein